MRRLLLLSLSSLALAACAAPTVYGPAAGPSASGYIETPITSDRYRVTFQGGSDAGMQRVSDLALRRAAEITLRDGYDWFRITGRYGEARPGSGPQIGIGGGGASFGRSSAVGVGGGISFPLGGGARVSQTLEIMLGKGPAPREPDVYDARQVQANIPPA